MSGHSKWSKVKHQKATTDVAKAAAFTRASRAIAIAVREGGGVTDPDNNFHLRLAIEKARDVNMPKENIDRIIEKAKGEGANVIETVTYEGYGPYGIAFFIEGATDNNKRAVSFVKQALEYAGGAMASPGSVGYLFERKGIIAIAKNTILYDTLFTIAYDAGARDVVEKDDVYEVYTNPQELAKVKTHLEKNHVSIETVALIMDPITPIALDPEKQAKIESLIEKLEELDDVQKVYTNLDY